MVYVVTGLDLGWDCVVAVYTDNVTMADLLKLYPEGEYVISNVTIESKVEEL